MQRRQRFDREDVARVVAALNRTVDVETATTA
jgi:hypothetical protein